MLEFINQLKAGLAQPLPGVEAQHRMANNFRRSSVDAPADARVACVLLLLYPKNNHWHIVLIQRVSHDKRDRHRGQISFPGGKLEETDSSLLAGALREAEEEVGVNVKKIQALGRLTELYIPVSNFLVHPFVGFAQERPPFVPQPSEVQSILEAPLSVLQAPSTLRVKDIKVPSNIILKDVPYFDIEGHVVWGATAMILSEFLAVIEKSVAMR